MTAREFLTTVTIILTVMALGSVIEVLVPMFADKPWKRGRRGANLRFTALSSASNWILASVAVVAALRWRPAGVMARIWLPIAEIGR
jgi:hypothetical protein